MRQEIERLLGEYQAARRAREAVDRDAAPRAWAQADLDLSAAEAHLGNAMRDAARRTGLVRELGRALGGTGIGVARLAFVAEQSALAVELEGAPDSPAERQAAASAATADRIHRLADDFYAQTGVELAFPWERLAA